MQQRVRWGSSPWLCLGFVIDATLWKVPPHPCPQGLWNVRAEPRAPGGKTCLWVWVCGSALHLAKFLHPGRENPFSPSIHSLACPRDVLSSKAVMGGSLFTVVLPRLFFQQLWGSCGSVKHHGSHFLPSPGPWIFVLCVFR